MDETKEPKRAVIEYRETPFDGKTRVMNRVLDPVSTPEEAHKAFWATPVWPAGTKKIEIIKVDWID